MDISAASFRDHILEAVSIIYDWQSLSHTVEIRVRSHDGAPSKYRVAGVTDIDIGENFAHVSEIEFCTVISAPGRIYISFDPYTEGAESKRDNYRIVGQEISVVL